MPKMQGVFLFFGLFLSFEWDDLKKIDENCSGFFEKYE